MKKFSFIEEQSHEERMEMCIDFVEYMLDSDELKKIGKKGGVEFYKELLSIKSTFGDYAAYTLREWQKDSPNLIEEAFRDCLFFNVCYAAEGKSKNPKKRAIQFLDEFLGGLWHYSDRMTINRLLCCKLLLENALDACYEALDETDKGLLFAEK